ncbi:serine/threonine/tyrosine-interacting-like protein 1 [Lingula anatina]|uniref:Serine/threonine/tyrosine-interacting-like protein 1 n=1 Tax=Lingula anatina TaxID=7574 RepID=A0A1S3HY40_LINAN|nr:serine/threonine/tyrosine-interacting-like protein 1 [Lingula anatina]XP_013405456.1 serine/threonine/tyrosine-interacting-like protein 1 [Lingula anatina]|eukprot:XP_013405455.1 serine/threonine/tyrosine-interacting-like protein 1 [Lingula anatina]
MAGIVLLEATDLYNLLNAATIYPCLSDPNYMMLLDARKKHEYNESHVVTSKKAPKNENGDFTVPYGAELECKQHVVVYDGNTDSLKDTESPAYQCASVMAETSRNPVNILKGGYEDFSALYPFLRTQKIIFMPQEMDNLKTYPIEVIPGFLYMGNMRQGNAAYIQKDLKVKGHINCCVEPGEIFKEQGPQLLHIPVEDNEEADMYSQFKEACTFLDEHRNGNRVVLVYSARGISRSACIVMAYLMHHNKWTLKEAYQHALRCSPTVRPNRGFVEQLAKWEEEVLGQKTTDISDPNF